LDSCVHWLDVSDGDWLFHKYKTHDGVNGTRKVRQLMMLEVKTFGAMPRPNQLETLWIYHQIMRGHRDVIGLPGRDGFRVWCHGVCILQLDTDTPEIGGIVWHAFDEDGTLRAFSIKDSDELAAILRFDRRPNEPDRRLDVRLHHKTQLLLAKRTMPLGFTIEEIEKRVS
jgi:hypothetical protein